jgi:hypothetical protein
VDVRGVGVGRGARFAGSAGGAHNPARIGGAGPGRRRVWPGGDGAAAPRQPSGAGLP